MKTSQFTRRMMIPALLLGLAGFAQAGKNQTQHSGGGHQRSLRVVARATQVRGLVYVHTSVREIRSYPRLPALKFTKRQRVATARQRHGRYLYSVTGKRHGSRVFVTVQKSLRRRVIATGSTTARVRPTNPPPVRPTTYIVSRYHPLTGKHIHTQKFKNRSAALNWYNHNKKLWWLFVYSGFSKTPKEYRATSDVCRKSAARYNKNLLDGKRAKAMPPRITFKTAR